MLAKNYDDDNAKIKYPAMVQRKYDGVRCIAYLDTNGNVVLQSRTGKPWNHLIHIRDELIKNKFITSERFFIDGELYTDKLSFQDIVGICRKQLELTSAEIKKSKMIEYHIYDCWSLDEPKQTFDERNNYIKSVFSKYKPKSLVMVPTFTVTDIKEMEHYYKQFLKEGYEGIMIRNIKSVYKMGPTRSNDLQKYKPIKTDEYLITDFTEGSGTEKGAVIWICRTKEGNVFNVRPEGTREERQELYKNGKKYIGKLLTVEFQELTDDGIPRFPRGLTIRDYE
jgi:DNA ligase-1